MISPDSSRRGSQRTSPPSSPAAAAAADKPQTGAGIASDILEDARERWNFRKNKNSILEAVTDHHNNDPSINSWEDEDPEIDRGLDTDNSALEAVWSARAEALELLEPWWTERMMVRAKKDGWVLARKRIPGTDTKTLYRNHRGIVLFTKAAEGRPVDFAVGSELVITSSITSYDVDPDGYDLPAAPQQTGAGGVGGAGMQEDLLPDLQGCYGTITQAPEKNGPAHERLFEVDVESPDGTSVTLDLPCQAFALTSKPTVLRLPHTFACLAETESPEAAASVLEEAPPHMWARERKLLDALLCQMRTYFKWHCQYMKAVMRQAECDELCFVHPFMSNTSQEVIENMAREAAEARREAAILYSGIMLSPLAKQCGNGDLEMNFYECFVQYVINYLSSESVFHECTD